MSNACAKHRYPVNRLILPRLGQKWSGKAVKSRLDQRKNSSAIDGIVRELPAFGQHFHLGDSRTVQAKRAVRAPF
jgi:hypothetical protein